MDEHKDTTLSTLFTLRVWSEPRNDDQVEWRGQVRHVLSGEVRYFRQWEGLVCCLEEMIPSIETAGGCG